MKKYFCFILIIAILSSVFTANASSGFSDVPAGHYAENAISEVKRNEIITGYPNGTYCPDAPVTRAEMAVMMCRMAGEEPIEEKTDFSDVPKNYWAAKYIAGACKKSIIAGDGKGHFRPEDFVTLEEAIKMTVMATGKANAVSTYPGNWSCSFMDIARICNITDNLLTSPGENVTRADVALMIFNALKIKNNPRQILFARHIYNSYRNIPTNAAFSLDLSTFSKDNTIYIKELAKASAVLSMTSYDYINPDAKTDNNTDRILKYMGFNTITKVETGKLYSDNHITTMYLGKRTINLDGKDTNIISVVFKGTGESQKEWASNFDIGSSIDMDIYTKENHKGYDITAQRAIDEIEKYIADSTLPGSQNIFWITGHSRGASLANLCGVYLGDTGEKCFVYGFAPSMTTTRTDAGKYSFIFNIVNSDDIITYMPLAKWGFKNFGKTANVSVSNDFLEEWQKSTGLNNYKFKDNTAELVTKMSEFSPGRNACYEYVEEDIIAGYADTAEDAEKLARNLISIFPKNAIPYLSYKIEESTGDYDKAYVVKFCMQPAFYMQTIGYAMADIKNIPILIMIPVPKQMESAYRAALSSYTGGIIHPHTPETYYVLASNLSQEDFK